MKNLWTLIREKFFPKSQDSILLKACRDGNPHAAHVALKAGANPNTLTYLGEYGYSPWEYEPQYTGTVYATPLIIAATSATNSDADGYYQVIKMLVEHPKTNLNQVVSGHRAEWRSEHHHNDGYPADFEEDYHISLRQVLSQFGQPHSTPPAIPSDLYPISPQMATFLQATLLHHEEKERNLKQAFSYMIDGLIAHDGYEQQKLALQKAKEQKIASL